MIRTVIGLALVASGCTADSLDPNNPCETDAATADCLTPKQDPSYYVEQA